MKKIKRHSLLPHILAVVIFLIIASLYCKPALEGKVLSQSDVIQWLGMSKDQQNYFDTVGHPPLWTNGMFSGMPGYLTMGYSNNLIPAYFVAILSLYLPQPVNFFFLACICFYFLCCVLGVRSWIGIFGALMYAYATYNPIIISVGHVTKMISIALMPGLLGSLLLLFNKKYWIGASLTAVFTSALIAYNHYQIIYYSMIVALFACVAFAIRTIREKDFKHLFLTTIVTIIAVVIGVATNAVGILPTQEYAKETIREGSGLAQVTDSTKQNSSVNEEYAYSYSLGLSEPFVMLVPRIFGGSSDKEEVSQDKSKAIEALQSMPQELAQQLGYPRYYWGGISGVGTSGPPYVGAIVCFLAIIGFIITDKKYKWWMLICSVLAIVMSWGGYFKEFNGLLLHYLPLYSKFRAPSMIIVIPTLLFNVMAVLALDKIFYQTKNGASLIQSYKKALIITAGLFALLFFMYMSFDYLGDTDKQVLKQVNNIPQEQVKSAVKDYFNALAEDRKGLFISDILRSFLFIAVVAGMLWLYLKNKINVAVVGAAISVLSFIDLITVDVKYLNTHNFVTKDDYSNTLNPSESDKQIMQDKSFYRVLDLRYGGITGAFNQAALSAYFHKSIGGYHPAKLSLYQDLIENQLYKYPNCRPSLNMLNTKYIIEQDGHVQQNPNALGNTWFVKAIKFVQTPREEMDALANFTPGDTVIVQNEFKDIVKPVSNIDSAATITMLSNHNDTIVYKSKSETEQVAVFSEVYYKEGWNVYVDGKKSEYSKVDYVLRGMNVPAGEHTIEFIFEPGSHAIGWKITSISGWIIILLLMVGIYFEIRKKRKF